VGWLSPRSGFVQQAHQFESLSRVSFSNSILWYSLVALKSSVLEFRLSNYGGVIFFFELTVHMRLTHSGSLVGVNPDFQKLNDHEEIDVSLKPFCTEAEMDEQWSFVGSKSNQRWIWYAVDHSTNTLLAYVFGKRKDEVFKKLQILLEPFNIKRYYTDDWGAYE